MTSTDTIEGVLTNHVRMVIDNDRRLYAQRRAIVARHLGGEDGAVSLCADALRDWVERVVGLESFDPNGLRLELLSVAVSNVDWVTLARDYIEEARS